MADLNDLPAGVRRLIRPRLVLRADRDSQREFYAGVWGGIGVVPLLPEVSRKGRHWLTVDCSWLDEQGFCVSGCFSLYRVPNVGFMVAHDPKLNLDDVRVDGKPLYAHEELSLPDERALNAYLTEEEKADPAYRDLDLEFLKAAQEVCPLYRDDLDVVLGGWHVGWPDGPPALPRLQELNERVRKAGGPGCMEESETYRVDPYRLAVWTLRDAEPWVEVWAGPDGELHAVERIT